MATELPTLCLRCDARLEPSAWLCPTCGGPTLVAPATARFFVTSDEVLALAARREAAQLLMRWQGAPLPAPFEAALKDPAHVAGPVTLAAAHAIVARLKSVGVAAKVAEGAHGRAGFVRRLFRPLPLLLVVAGAGLALWHWTAVILGVLTAVLVAAVARGSRQALLTPRTSSSVPENIEKFQEIAAALPEVERAHLRTIVDGAATLVQRADEQGLTTDASLDYGMGGAVAALLAEALQVAGSPAGDTARAERLGALATTVRELTAQPERPLREGAEVRLRREAKVAKEILADSSTLPALDKQTS